MPDNLFNLAVADFAGGLRKATTPVDIESAIWQAQAGPQHLAFHHKADEIFYGGQAGGGKSDLLLGLSMTQHRNSIIFRRDFGQFAGADGLIARSKTLLDGIAKYNGNEHLWRDIPGDRRLEFGGVFHEDDKRKYKGRPHDLKGFDELPEFTETQYLFLIAWARTIIPGQRVRIVSTGNPPTAHEGEWVIKRWGAWLDPDHDRPASPGEIRWYARLNGIDTEVDGPEIITLGDEKNEPRSRTFIPASLDDNQYLRDTDYRSVLQGLPEPLRSQLLYGDFSLDLQDDAFQVLPSAWIQAAQSRWRDWMEAGAPRVTLTRLGVDVGTGALGRDQSCIAPIYDMIKCREIITLDKPDDPDVAVTATKEAVRTLLQHDRAVAAIVDNVGLGAGVHSELKTEGYNSFGFSAGKRTDFLDATGEWYFQDWRAAMWWLFREMLSPTSGIPVIIPDDPELTNELKAPRFSYKRHPKRQFIIVEQKASIRTRLFRSTDRADALLQGMVGWMLCEEEMMQRQSRVTYQRPRIGPDFGRGR